jgi:hypothetical protein
MQNTYRSNEEDTSTIIKISGEIPDVAFLEKESRTEVKGVQDN